MSIVTLDIKIVKAAILAGKLVGIPTDTVYGIAVDARNDVAVNKLYQVKRRSKTNPLILQCGNIEQIKKYAELNSAMLESARKYWPGSTTLILPLKKDNGLSRFALAGDGSIGMRIADCSILQKLLCELNVPVFITSANKSGTNPAIEANQASEIFADEIEIFLDSDEKPNGKESQIIKIHDNGNERKLR